MPVVIKHNIRANLNHCVRSIKQLQSKNMSTTSSIKLLRIYLCGREIFPFQQTFLVKQKRCYYITYIIIKTRNSILYHSNYFTLRYLLPRMGPV